MSESIKYYSTPVHLDDQIDHFRAIVVSDGTFTTDDMVEELKKRTSGVPIHFIKPFIELIFQIRDEQLANNRNVYLQDTYYSLTVPQRFNSEFEIPEYASHAGKSSGKEC